VEDYLVWIGCDYGDAPDSFLTLHASNGPRHAIRSGWHLGTEIDREDDGQPSPNADLDDNTDLDDEDGVIFTSALMPGFVATVEVEASVAGFLDAWIDFNQDQQFNHPAERITIAGGNPVGPGTTNVNFTVPPGIPLGDVCARFRFSSVGGLPPWGPAKDGEVEDYYGEDEGVVITDDNVNPQEDLVLEMRDGRLVLDWAVGQQVTVEEADSLHGPWRPSVGAMPPFEVVPDQPCKFFRLRYGGDPVQ
jgi:hypothetical protein